ncbi:hypothetical protein M405DRAFT_930700 [Rhizopogon salebrosus TDB-379]|nr:hypothetical protein M405DRAFT_930700 [Rhizopogon salebrosus TDB-379]
MSSTIFGHGGKHKRGKKDDDNSENSDVDDDFADEATDNDPEVENDKSDLDGITDPEDIAEDRSNKADSFNGRCTRRQGFGTLSRSTKEYHNSSTGKCFLGREGLN